MVINSPPLFLFLFPVSPAPPARVCSNTKMANLRICNLMLFIFFTSILSAYAVQGQNPPPPTATYGTVAGARTEELGSRGADMKRNSRRVMIGSTAPTCTYNECRGCKYKCTAEQVPVEGNDPINSPYHYRCVCHR
ncbi:EPIDERMAL PATTERNING FACTOR-like protein 9 [Tripterygium wilfordii]|uniref:EPIDERMAL PATTERNING FACTOR-like protein 9 n=1 Tax=Tripterygium wilfordii TaxID=458696 RepID=A0A7J7BXH1_TRIWF|nr:EPIDERMAL PATTERNING FACTOR-like protein 9 isoform X2 [Tripterygium wilfordii]KAF5726554.1 EPIDERMAL PATTERNING FACTOR-like protein 9 [Tripterygium wilfordii]